GAALVLRAAWSAAAEALLPLTLLFRLTAAAGIRIVVHHVGEELGRIEVDLAELDLGPLFGSEHVVDICSYAELSGERVFQAEQRPCPSLVGKRCPPRGLDLDEQVPAEAEHGLRRDLEVTLDVILPLARRWFAHADARRRLGVAAHAGDGVEPNPRLDV